MYNLLSARDFALNAEFVYASFTMGGTCTTCTSKTVIITHLHMAWDAMR